MILSDNQLVVPGSMYKVRVKCISTRRLTTIEWLILSCTKKFERLPSMAGKTLKYAFEEVFQFQNSELLIKPCLKNLQSLKVIQVAGGTSFDYGTLRFSDIYLTDLGMIMLKDGLLPGEPREIPLSIFYNPLTGKISSTNHSITGAKDAIEFGTKSDYDSHFPEETIISELQSGAIGSGRFTASKFRIEEIECLVSSDWQSTISISVNADEKGIITTTPAIIADGVKGKIQELFFTKTINSEVTGSLPSADELKIRNIIGSGKAMKTAFLNVCKNGRVLFIEAGFYNMFKRNTTSFKEKTLILFNSHEEFKIATVEKDKILIIHLPEEFPNIGCAVINDRGGHASFCKKYYTYEDKTVEVPLVVEDDSLFGNPAAALQWLETISYKRLLDDARYAGLFTLPILIKSLPKVQKLLASKWVAEDISVALGDIQKIKTVCDQLRTEMFDIGVCLESLLDRIDFSDNKSALDIVEKIFTSGAVRLHGNLYRELAGRIIGKIKQPSDYIELLGILKVLRITSHEEALQYDNYVESLYSKAVVEDIIVAVAEGTYNRLPEFFEMDTFFNDYEECVTQIENHVSGLKIFEKCNPESILNSILACPDIAALQSFVAEFKAKNAALMVKGINVYDVLRNYDEAKAGAYIANLKELEEAISTVLDDVYKEQEPVRQIDGKTIGDPLKRKIYIVDTCAMMHHPEIFQYFGEEEYVRVPTKVIDELGKIKDKRNSKYSSELSDTARKIAREIEYAYMRIFNETNKIRFLVENASLNLLPPELDPNVPDNQILSVALKYKDWDVSIISDDGVFRLTSIAQNIHPITSEEFISSHKESFVSLTERIKAFNKIGSNQGQNTASEKASQDIDTKDIVVNTATQSINVSSEDAKPLKEAGYLYLSPGTIDYLKGRKIKTIGDFRKLTLESAKSMPVKGQQFIYRNEIVRALTKMNNSSSQPSEKE